MLPVLTCLVVAHKPSTSWKTRAQEGSEHYKVPVGMDPTVPSRSHLAEPKPQTKMCAKRHPEDAQQIILLAALTLEAVEPLPYRKSGIPCSENHRQRFTSSNVKLKARNSAPSPI